MTALASRPPVAPPSRGARYVLGPVLVALVAGAATAATYRVFIGTSLGQTVDTAALHGAEVNHARVVEVMNRTLNGTSLASLVLVCLVAAAIGVIRRRLDLAVGAALMVIGANLSTQLLKSRLPRPDLDDFPAPNSFPSGHTTAAVSVAFALVLVLPHAIRGTVALIGAIYVTVIAIATVWAEWHRPSDTVAAMLIVLTWGAVVAAVLRLIRLRVPGVLERANRPTTLLFAVTAVVAGTAGLIGLATVTLSVTQDWSFGSGRFAFLTGSAAILAAVAVVFLIWTRLAAGVQTPPAPGDEHDEPR